jgi:uncharacterized protein (TIGR02600 family)
MPRFPLSDQTAARHSRRGLALVVVLAFLVLISALIVAFFSSVQADLTGSKNYARGVTVKQLAETATNVVIGQISDATKSYLVPGDTASTRMTWASQPGLIHTYGDDGKPGRSFKLYSSPNMVEEPGTDFLPARHLDTEVPDTWPAAPALFSDLNSPVLVAATDGKIKVDGKSFTANYPILDPLGLYNPATGMGVEGFSIRNARGFSQASWTPNESHNPTVPTVASKTANPAPMPVRWLYVLRDGTLTAPDPTGTTTATWSNAADNLKPTLNNPIVGRIAFWADDDTCKLNINTASEGVFWDRGWAMTRNENSVFGEIQLNYRIPVKGEYQRYPGHPATTCLSPVLGGLLPDYHIPPIADDGLPDFAPYERYYRLLPRVREGGTRGGTQSSSTGIVPDQNRLFSSVDEMIFAAPEGPDPQAPSNATARFRAESVTRGALEKAKFFLTAHNRAPEVNAFGRPRLALWQLQQERDPNAGNPNKTGEPDRPRNAVDELLAFCSTINSEKKFKFYFQRYSFYLRDPTNVRTAHPDIPFLQLPEYGFQPPSSQYPGLDWTGAGMERNRELYQYLQNMTSSDLPGWGGKFTDKYSAPKRDQILTEMIDLVRAGTNSYARDPKLPPRYEYAPARGLSDAASGETQIVPLSPRADTPGGVGVGTKGLGRFPVITEAALIFYATNDAGNKMRAVLMFTPYSPTAGSWTWSPLVRYVVKDGGNLRINGKTGLFRDKLVNLVTSRCGYGSGGEHNTAFTGTYASFRYWNGPGRDLNKNIPASGFTTWDEEKDYPFVSDEIDIDPAKRAFTFGGGEITVEVHAGYALAATEATKVQTFKIKFPPAPSTWPNPTSTGENNDYNRRVFGRLIQPDNDTVRSVQIDPLGPARGDLRYVASLPVVTADYFAGYPGGADGPGYGDPSERVIHSIRNGNGQGPGGTKYHADLVDGTNGSPASSPGNPIAARGMRGAKMSNGVLGDYDNGPTGHQDGAYINKPDDYYGGEGAQADNVTPNRQVCSAVMFGSLPAGEPWRTLLFCPNPAGGRSHPGFQGIRDHTLLDFFTMPVIEPYAISEPFSSAGKVNLNYQIAPFTYITRSTAVRGVLKSTRVVAIPNWETNYKGGGSTIFRKEIDRDETIAGFEERFGTVSTGPYNGDKGMFRCASEICDMYLVPKGATLSAVKGGWWRDYAFTGDNAREVPYSHIYQRVTTKSNTYTVHMRVQVLRKRSTTDPATWVEGQDQVASEYRGSSTVERYIDPSDTSLKDFAKDPKLSMDDYYKFRIINTKRFAP